MYSIVTTYTRLLLMVILFGMFVSLKAQNQTIPTGSFIVNMGITPQTVNNGLKPYGMIYDLVKNHNVPVYWVINQTKSKDGTDFTHNSIGYRGGTFIIPASARTTTVNNRIAYWQGEGVVGNSSVSNFTVDVTYVLTTMPRWAMDSENGSIAITYLTNAGIPNTAYYFRTPAQLNPCDDIFVMPHADPTWSTHGPLFNFNRNQRGAIYSACRAVSQLEGTACINPNNSAQRLNFLTTNGMVLYNNHDDASPPFSTAHPTDPVFQNIGITDGAHETGAEQIYYPTKNTSDWRATTKLGVFDPTTGDIPSKSNGPGAIAVYGRGFGVDSFGLVMYHAGHRLHPTGRKAYDPEMVSATRQFFNFSFLAAFDKAPQIAMNNIPTTLYSAITYTGFTALAGPSGNGPFTYQWSSTTPGTFSNPTGSSTSFTPSVVAQNTPGFITITVTDACGRSKFASFSTTFAPLPPISNNSIVQHQAIHAGTAPATFTGSTPNGGNGSYTYSWEKSTNNGSSWSLISGANNQNFTDGVITTATYYRRIVNSTPATASTSNVVKVTILLSTTTSSVPVACNGDSTGSVTVTPSGGSSLCMPRTFTSPATCTNCTQIVSGSTSVNMNNGDRVCVLANTTYTGSVNMNGGEFIVCGTANPSNFSSNGGTIFINGSMHVNVLNLGSNLTVHNYGTLTANTNITGSGRMYNYNTITIGGDYDINSNGVLENYGTLTSTGATFNNSGSTTNNGIIQAHRHVQNNSNTFFINNCTVIAGENFNNSSTFTNNGLVSVGLNTHLNSQGHFVQGKGGSLTTNSIHVNSTISGPVSGCASVQVATTTTINSSGTVTGRVDFCDANGIETNTGTMNNTIAACTCQEYSPNFDASYSYAWSNGATTPVVNNLPAGVYSITVRDAHNNPSVAQVTITEPSPLVVTAQHVNSTYPAAGDGSITLTPQGGAGNYTYVWGHGPTTQNLSGLNAGTYTVTVTDANGCSANHSIVIGNTYPLILSNLIAANQTILSGNIPVHFTGSLPSGGTGTYVYQWQSGHNVNGPFVSIAGATSQHYSLNHNTGNLYFRRLVTSSPVPVSTSNVVSLVVLNYTLNATANSPIIEGQTINLSAIPSNPGGTFSWVGPNGYTGTGIAPSIPNAPMAAAGLYTVTWTVDNVVLTAVRNVVVLPSLTVVATGTNERYPTALDGTVTATVSGGTGPFTYLWNTGHTTITVTGLPAGTYTVIATDANGFRDTADVTIVNNIPFFNLAVCYEGAIGTPATHARYGYVAWNLVSRDITRNTVTNQGALPQGLNLGNDVFTRLWSTNAYALNPFHYVWTLTIDGTTKTSTIAPEGHLVTPQNSCGAHFPVILDNTITSSQTILSGTSPQVFNGSLPTGGTHNQFSYQWEKSTDGGSTWVSVPSGTTKDFPEGSISVVTSYRRIVSSWSVAPVTSNVVVVTPIVIPVTPTHNGPVCAGATVQLSANTVAGATYAWVGPNGFSSNAQYPSISSTTLADAGVYTLSITVDGVTNTSTTTLNINQITAGINKSDVLCYGLSTGSANLTVNGGTGNYGYQWSNHTQTEDQVNTLAAGTYSVLVNDMTTGCQAYTTVEITQPADVIVTSTSAPATYPGSGDGSASVQVSGGTPGYTYQWAHGPSTASLSGLNSGTYTVIVRDANQCEKFDTIIISNTYELIASNTIQASQTILSGTAPQLFTGNVPTGGTGVYTYTWQLSTNGGVSWINYPSGNQPNLQEGILNSLTHYRRIVSSGPVPALTSNVISVTPVSYSITAANNGPVFVGSALNLYSTPSTLGGTYSWSGPNGFTANVQNPVISSAQLSDAGVYTVYQHIDNVTVSATTVPVVLPVMSPNTITASQTILTGTTPAPFDGSVMSGGSGSFTYQWEKSTDGGSTWTIIVSGTNQDFPEGPVSVVTSYKRIVHDGVMPATTSNLVSVTPVSYSITAANNSPVFVGSALNLYSTPSTVGGTYSWSGPNGFTANVQNPVISSAQLSDAGVYTVYQHIDNVTVSATTVPVVLPVMSPNTITASQTILTGTTPAPFDGSVMSGGSGSFTYQWEKSTDGGSTWTIIVSGTNQDFPEGPVSVVTSYKRVVNDGVMPATTSNLVSVTPVSYSITASNNGPVFVGSALNLYSTPSTLGGTYSWSGPNGFTANVQNPVISSAQLSDVGVYTVYQHIDNVTVSATTVPVVLPVMSPNTITASQTILTGTTPAPFDGSVMSGGSGSFTYQWEKSTDGGSTWTIIVSGTNQDFPEGPVSVVTSYKRIVNDGVMPATTSNLVSVTPVSYSITASNNGPVFVGSALNLYSTPSTLGGTYSWSGPNGFTANVQNPVISSAQLSDAGVYTVYQHIDNVTVSATTVPVVYPTLDNVIAASQTLIIGNPRQTLTGNVPTGGTGLYNYQWEMSTNGGNSWTTLTGATQVNFPGGPIGFNTEYRRIVTSGSLPPVTSNVVSVVLLNYSITASNNGPIFEGSTLVLSAFPSQSGGTYSWVGPNGYTGSGLYPEIQNAPLAAGGVYTVTQYIDNTSVSAQTLAVVLPIMSPNTITASQTILSGTTPAPFDGSVMSGGSGSFTYQWERSTDGGSSWTTIVSATTQNFPEGPITVLTSYRRIVSDGVMPTTTSNIVSVTPVSYSITAANNGPVFEGSALNLYATPSTVGGTYSWSGPNGFTANVQNPIISSAQLTDAGVYTVYQHIDNVTVSATTVPVVLPVMSPNTITASQTILSGTIPAPFDGSVMSGGSGSFTYQWEKSTDGGSTWTIIVSGTNQDFPEGPVSVVTSYKRVVNDGVMPATTSNIVSVTPVSYSITAANNGPVFVGSALNLYSTPSTVGGTYSWSGPNGFTANVQNPIISSAQLTDAGVYTVYQHVDNVTVSATTVPVVLPVMSPNTITASQTILSGTTPAPFDGSVMSGGSGSFTYQWERSTDGGSSWTTIVSATTQNFPEGPITVLTSYRRIVSDGVMPATTSNIVSVTPVSYSITASNNGPVFVGSALNLYATPSTLGGTYSWSGPNGFTANVQNPIISSAQLTDAGVYTVYQHIDNVTVSATTVPVVLPVMSPNTITASQTILSGTTPAPFDGSVMSGGSGSFTYQWERSTDGGSSWTTIVSATSQNFPEGPLTVLTSFRRIVSDGVMPTTTSNIVTVTPLSYTLTASATDPMCVGWNLDLFANSNIPNPTYVWSGPSGFTAIGSQQQIANATLIHAGNYTVTVSKDNLILNAVVNVPIANPFGGLTAASAGPVCEGQTLVISATVLPHLNYTWFGPNGFSQSGHQMSIPNAQHASTGIYTLYATNGFCTPQYRYVQGVVNVPNPNPVTNSPVCETFDMYLTAFPNIGAVYNWSGPNGFTATGDSIIRSNALPSFTGRYYVTGTIPGCGSVSDSVVVVIGRLVNGVTINSNTPVCENSTMLINATPVQGANYIWSGPNGFTSLNSNLTLSGVTSQDSGVYTLTVTSPGCAPYVTSLNAIVNSPSLLQAVNNGPICIGGSLSLSAYCPFPTSYTWSGPLGFAANGLNVGFNNGVITQTGVYSVAANIPGCGQVIATTAAAINEPASILTPVTNGPLCSGMNLELSVEAYQNASYVWTGPSGMTTSSRVATITRIMPNFAGIYSVQVDVPACGIYTAVTSNLTVRNIPLVGAFSPTPLVCETDVIYLYSSMSRDLGTSAWYGPDGWSSNAAQVGRNHAELSHAGVYTFVANVNGCGPVYDLVTIGVNSRIPFNLPLGSNTPVCTGSTLMLSAEDFPGVNYLWMGPNGFSSTSRITSIGNVPTSARGQYMLYLSKPSCNVISRSLEVFVGSLELPVITATSPVCSGDLLNIRTQFIPDASYSWTGPNGYTNNSHEFYIIQATPSHGGVYSLNATVPGCGAVSNSISVTVNNPFPVNPQMTTNSPICEGSDLVMAVADHPSAAYIWTGPNGFTSNNRNPRVDYALPSASGIYSLDIQIPGCPPRGLQVTAVVNSLPTITTSTNSPLCAGSALFLNASVTPAINPVSWAGPNGFSSNMLGSSISNAQTVNSGTYTFYVNVPGCGMVENIRNVVINSPVNVTSIVGSTTACVGNSLVLSASETGNASYFWSGPLGFTSNNRVLSIPSVVQGNAGQYSLQVSQQGCNPFTTTRNVTVNNITPPIATVDRTAYCSGQPIYFSSTAVTGALAYNWTGPAGYNVNNRWASRSNSNITHAGEYTLSVPTVQCGTFSTTVQVVVGPAINTASITSNSPACRGGDLNLMSNIPDAIGVTHTWIAPDASTFNSRNVSMNGIDMSVAGTYTYIVVSPGCGTATRTRRISVTDPTLVEATANSPICQGQVIYFTGTGPAGTTYSWQGPGGYMASTQFPARSNAQLSHAGVYTLNANVPGCGIVTTTTSVVVNVCRYADENTEALSEELPAENQELISSMKVYPNPFNSEVNVEWGDMTVFSIKVYDMNGKLVRDIEPGDVQAVKLEAGDLPSGVYMMTALTSAGPVSYRITRL